MNENGSASNAKRPRGGGILPWVFIVLLAGGAVVGYNYVLFRGKQLTESRQIPPIRPAPGFTLIERSGREFSSAELDGRVWIASFFFTRCVGPCPLITRQMSELQEAFAPHDDIRLVSFTVDPEFDTPEVLRTYAEGFGAVPDRWFFLTGQADPMRQMILKGFLLPFAEQEPEKVPTEGLYIHSTRLVLVDRKGMIRGYYEYSSPEAIEKLRADAIWLLDQYRTEAGG